MKNLGSNLCASLSGYQSDRSSTQLSDPSPLNAWSPWHCGQSPAETGWKTIAQDNPSQCSQVSSTTDGWSSETSNRNTCLRKFQHDAAIASSFDQRQSHQSIANIRNVENLAADDTNRLLSWKGKDSFTSKFRKNCVHRRPRKQLRPEKSAKRYDPGFKGVVLTFKTKVDSINNRTKLRIRSYYSCHPRTRNCRHHRHDSRRTFLVGAESTSSSAESDVDLVSSKKNSKRLTGKPGKQCASCKTKKTPLWRDAEDGTPLCNACGIRYKKYRIRCSYCWYVPRKAGKSFPICSNCGERVQYSHGRKKATFMFMTKYGHLYKKQ